MKHLTLKRTGALILFVSSLVFWTAPGWAIAERGDGGAAVYCRTDGTTRFPSEGYYMLDYALEISHMDDWYVVNDNPVEHMQAVAKVFESKLNDVDLGFKQNKLDSEFARNFRQLWFPNPLPLAPTNDQGQGKIPENCDGTLFQAATFKAGAYFYSPDLFNGLSAIGISQVSALEMHEFFRMGNVPSNLIPLWNRATHTRAFFNLKGSAFIDFLRSLGLIDEAVASKQLILLRFKRSLKSNADIIQAARQLELRLKANTAQVRRIEAQIEVTDPAYKCDAIAMFSPQAQATFDDIAETEKELSVLRGMRFSGFFSRRQYLPETYGLVAWIADAAFGEMTSAEFLIQDLKVAKRKYNCPDAP